MGRERPIFAKVFHRNVIVTDVLDHSISTPDVRLPFATLRHIECLVTSKQKVQRSLTVFEENLSARLVMTKTASTEKDGISHS